MKSIFRSPESKGELSPLGKILRRSFGLGLHGSRVSGVTLALYFGVLAFFGLFFVLPIAIAVRGAFLDQTGALTLDYFREVFRNPIYLEGFTNALRLATGSTLLAFAIAGPLAWISERFEFPAKRALSALLLLPMMLLRLLVPSVFGRSLVRAAPLMHCSTLSVGSAKIK
jgi:iron(III) transport system permease protein